MDTEDLIKRDVIEFAAHSGDKKNWRLALLVARSTVLQDGPGKPPPKANSNQLLLAKKLSTYEFADQSQVSRPTVMYFHKAWDLAAKDKLVPASTTLVPGQEVELPPASQWSQYYRQARLPKSKVTPIRKNDPPTPTPVDPPVPPVPDDGPEPTPVPEPIGPKKRESKLGSQVWAECLRLVEVKRDFPDESKDTWAELAGIDGKHQEVRRREQLLASSPPFQEMVRTDVLKWPVAQEIMDGPLLTDDERVALGAKFAAGTFTQTGGAKKTFRPIVEFTQQATPTMRATFLADVAMTIAQAEARFPRLPPAPEPDFDEEISASKWAMNFHTWVEKQTGLEESVRDRLNQARHAASMMLAMDPYLMSQVVREMQRQRELVLERYAQLEWWITNLNGEVNHPDRAGAPRVVIEVDPADAEIIDITSWAKTV